MKIQFAKFLLIFSVLSFSSATQWENINLISEKSPYKEIIQKFMGNASDAIAPGRTGRITNGIAASLGQFPFQIYMYSFEPSGAGYICGGSIIHQRWILTAAHCIDGIVKVEVYVGAINRFPTGEGSFIKKIVVTKSSSIIRHPNYDPYYITNDAGLVELPEDAPIEHNYVGIIGVPIGADRTRTLTGLPGTASGFGRTSDQASSPSSILNYAILPIVDNSVCRGVFGPSISIDQVCVESARGSTGLNSVCNGDSGGPLTVLGQNGQPIVVGIASFVSASGCEQGFPQVFARVTSFIPWIEANTGLSFS